MNVAITGASGFVGRRLSERLKREGHTVRAISIRAGVDPQRLADSLVGCEAIVNLAGESVSQRWTAAARERIRSSRVEGTRALVNAMRTQPPQVLVSASATGYYGSRGDEILTEASPPGHDFLGDISAAREREADTALRLRGTLRWPRSCGSAWCSVPAAAHCKRCCCRSAWASAVPWEVDASGCPGFTWTILRP